MKTSVTLLLLTLSFLSCSDLGVEGQPPQIRELTVSEKQLVESNSKFWLKLLKEVNTADAEKNVFISPLSISFALGMTLNGAKGATYDEMKSTLEFSDMQLDDINASYHSLMKTLASIDPDVQMQIANSIWHKNTFPVEPQFVQTNQIYFDAVVRAMDFSSEDAAPTINAWVNENTKGKITKIIEPPISDAVVMFLMNAVYFKGIWTYQFDKDDTQDDQFVLKDGSLVPCRMMNQQNTFLVNISEKYQVVDLPYANGMFSMTVVVPRGDEDINTFVSTLTPNDWQAMLGNLSELEAIVQMPKLKMEYDKSLKSVLYSLGMQQAFSDNADFRKINANGGILISEVKHKACVEVDEEGTEAAAVTVVVIELTSVGPSVPVIRIDRPYLFVIRERNTGAVLFVGKIMNPKG